MKHPNAPYAKRVGLGELIRALESDSRSTQVSHAFPATQDVQ
jgi:hypothetical protein